MKKVLLPLMFLLGGAASGPRELRLDGEVNPGSVQPLVQALEAPGDVTIRIDSPGGSVGAGLELVKAIDAHVGTVTCYVPRGGEAASMAFILLQVCDVRLVHEASILMAHGVIASPGPSSVEELEALVQIMRTLNTAMAEIMCARAIFPECEAVVVGPGLWMSGGDALLLGFADAVLKR